MLSVILSGVEGRSMAEDQKLTFYKFAGKLPNFKALFIMMSVYILECADGSYYTGVTNDIERRLMEHQTGYDTTCFTFKRRPVKLAFYEFFQTPSDAIAWEKRIKGWSRKKKKALIEGNWDKLQEFARCMNDSSHKNFNIDHSSS